MKEFLKKLLPFLILYLVYLILTLIIFHILGFYNFGDIPTKSVLGRILGLPFILTISTSVFYKKENNYDK